MGDAAVHDSTSLVERIERVFVGFPER